MSILDRIDELTNLCPCGAPPRPDSPYCGYDCEPTHRSIHTTSDTDGTQMRWRPDLVTAHNDHDLYDLGTMTWYTGRHNARLYQRGIPEQGQPITWHLRLDDGHRYVGLDMTLGDHVNVLNDEHEQRMTDAWTRLDRELGNRHHTEPAERHLSVWDQWQAQQLATRRAQADGTRQRIAEWLRANHLDPNRIPDRSPIRIRDGQICVREWVRDHNGDLQIHDDEPVTAPRTVPLIEPWPAGLHYDNVHTGTTAGWTGQLPDLAPTLQRITQALHQFRAGIAPITERMRHFVDTVYETQPEPADHPLTRVTAQRSNQPHGPQPRQRPPRQLRP